MWSHRRSRRESDHGAILRSHRAVPREEFVESLAERIDAERPVQRTAWSRLAFAAAASTLILGMFASFGGLGYATSGATSTYTVVRQAVVHHKLTVHVDESSASSQYNVTPAAPTQSNVAGQTQVRLVQPVQREQRPLEAADLAQCQRQTVLARVSTEPLQHERGAHRSSTD